MPNILSEIIEVCVFRIIDEKPQYLLLQRSSSDELYPNLWQIITGTIKKSEKTLNAVLRELNEETGISAKRLWTVPFVDSYYDLSKDVIQLAPIFAAKVDNESQIRLSSEHQNYKWLEHSQAKDNLVWPGQKHVLDIVQDFIAGGKEAGWLLEILNFNQERI